MWERVTKEAPFHFRRNGHCCHLTFDLTLVATCFYVQIRRTTAQKSDGYYHAIYLAISKKCQLDPARVVRALWVNANGLNVVVDDDVLRELPEGQDMVVKFSELPNNDSVGSNLGGDSQGSSASSSFSLLVFFKMLAGFFLVGSLAHDSLEGSCTGGPEASVGSQPIVE